MRFCLACRTPSSQETAKLMCCLSRIDSPPPVTAPHEPSMTASPSRQSQQPGSRLAGEASTAGGFQAIRIPTQPRSSVPQVRPESNALDGHGRETKKARVETEQEDQAGPVVVIEEERDPEKVLEERRRKREEIMAKFKAGGGKPAPPVLAVEGKEAAGSGAESVGSGGTRTGLRTGITTTGQLCRMRCESFLAKLMSQVLPLY